MSANMIQIFVPNEGRKTLVVTLQKKENIKYLYQKVKERLHIPRGYRIILVYDGSLLDEESSETLESKGFRLHSHLDWFLPMYQNFEEIYESEDQRQLVEAKSQVSANSEFLVEGECCVCLDDAPDKPRIKMTCGCIICAGDGCLKECCKDQVKNGKFIFTCPGCQDSWQHAFVRKVLSTTMTTEELKSFTEKVTSNFALDCPTMQSCPKCDNYITHDPQKAKDFKNKYWVRCPICTRNEGKNVEFCWVCLNPWKGNNLSCGNDICTGKDPRIQKLQTCGTKSIYAIHGVPIFRACVKCGALIEHADKCKHMTCKFCKCKFCFVCLKPALGNAGKWQCGSYNSICEVAPRQTSLFVILTMLAMQH